MAEQPLAGRLARLAGRRLVQPDQRSCGAAALVVARSLGDPTYAEVLDDPQTFDREVLAVHRRVTAVVDARGRAQVPWPRALGTPPWAVSRQLTGDSGVPHRTQLHRWHAAAAFDHVVRATGTGPVPVYVGNRMLPRHVVLALGVDHERLACYEPSSGRVLGVDRAALASGRAGLGGWGVVWFSVQPSARRTAA